MRGTHYLEHDNGGRGVVLVGHSQGSGVLMQLIREEIDGKPVQARIVSALLMGANVAVPRGKDVGGTFKSMPLCRTASQVGCIVTYVSFRSTTPPPPDSRFGRVAGEGLEAGCTNPAALAGGKGELHAYLSANGSSIVSTSTQPVNWVTPAKPIDTPFVSVPGLLTAQCVSNDKGSYLEVTVNGDPKRLARGRYRGRRRGQRQCRPELGSAPDRRERGVRQPARHRSHANEIVSRETEPLTDRRAPRKHEGTKQEFTDVFRALRGFVASSYFGRIATARSGAPLPPPIFIGSAIMYAPVMGSRSRFVRFSNAGTSCS